MTAAELRALIAGATPAPWALDPEYPQTQFYGTSQNFIGEAAHGKDADAALIVALRNNAERFAELLAAEEAKAEPRREWTSCRPCDGWDYRVDGVYAGQVWPSSSGEWWWCLRDNLDNGIEPTGLLARAAVEAAVRAGR